MNNPSNKELAAFQDVKSERVGSSKNAAAELIGSSVSRRIAAAKTNSYLFTFNGS